MSPIPDQGIYGKVRNLISNQLKFAVGPYRQDELTMKKVKYIYENNKPYIQSLFLEGWLDPENDRCSWAVVDALGNFEATHMKDVPLTERLFPPGKFFIAFGKSSHRGKPLFDAGRQFINTCLGQARCAELHPWFIEAVNYFGIKDQHGSIMAVHPNNVRPDYEPTPTRGIKREREVTAPSGMSGENGERDWRKKARPCAFESPRQDFGSSTGDVPKVV